jgi:hypothetical protein
MPGAQAGSVCPRQATALGSAHQLIDTEEKLTVIMQQPSLCGWSSHTDQFSCYIGISDQLTNALPSLAEFPLTLSDQVEVSKESEELSKVFSDIRARG